MVEGVASFYSFLSLTPKGRNTIRLCGNIVDRFSRLDSVQAAFVAELGIKMGQASHDRVFQLGQTPCTDLCEQADAAIIDDKAVIAPPTGSASSS